MSCEFCNHKKTEPYHSELYVQGLYERDTDEYVTSMSMHVGDLVVTIRPNTELISPMTGTFVIRFCPHCGAKVVE